MNKPTVEVFSSKQATIEVGESTQLYWQGLTTGQDSHVVEDIFEVDKTLELEIDHGVGDVMGQAAVPVAPPVTTTYTLTARNRAGENRYQTTVTVVTPPENTAPAANDQALSTPQDTPASIALTGDDADSGTLRFTLVTPPTKGELRDFDPATGRVTYVPNAGASGQDSFTFTVSDGQTTSAPATVTINLGVVNAAPQAQDQTLSTDEDTPLTITLQASDPEGDTLSYELVNTSSLTLGALGALDSATGQVTYTPNPNVTGQDSFTYRADDGLDDSNVATVSITISPVNDAPTNLTLDNDTVEENQPVGTAVGTFTPTDLDSSSFSYTLVDTATYPDNASFTIDGNQLRTAESFDFEAKSSYIILVQVDDGRGGLYSKSFTVRVGNVDERVIFTSISAGSQHTCALDDVGKAYCWGKNAYGEVGNGRITPYPYYERLVPTPVQPPLGASSSFSFTSISSGNSHTCALGSDNQAYCWGRNSRGELGDGIDVYPGMLARQPVPTPVKPPLGASSSFVFTSISSGNSHTCALGSDSRVYCWGSNEYGQLGDGTFRPSSSTYTSIPTPVNFPQSVPPAFSFISLEVGSDHTCALGSDDRAYCWGADANGGLGKGTVGSESTPTPVISPPGTPSNFAFISISLGSGYTCALGNDDRAYCWGSNSSGQLGNGTYAPFGTSDQPTPTPVILPANVIFTSIKAGGQHACAFGNRGEMYCWGSNFRGKLGNNTPSGSENTPSLVSPPADAALSFAFASFSVGFEQTCALGNDDQTYCWGSNIWATLGDGTTDDRSIPTLVSQPQ